MNICHVVVYFLYHTSVMILFLIRSITKTHNILLDYITQIAQKTFTESMKNTLHISNLEKIWKLCVLTDLSFKFNCPISFPSSSESISSPLTKSSIFVWATFAFIRLRIHRRTEPTVSFVWDHMSKSSTCLPWFGNRTISERCLPWNALGKKKN